MYVSIKEVLSHSRDQVIPAHITNGPQVISHNTERQSFIYQMRLVWTVLELKKIVKFAACVTLDHPSHVFLRRDG